ncbi:MAG: aminopeptidase, partial [Candidatus Eremiobacteraeota bacterium]|nr:aminopeptidase [Candidatus Eremiobacteraeota bacterium]
MRPQHFFAMLCAAVVGGGFAVARGAEPAQPVLTPYSPIAAMADAVNADRLQATIDALVAFGTRNDFSEKSSTAGHGVFAARDWIAAQFRQIAAGTNGRLTVALDTYLQPKTRRTPRAVLESSVVATLRGDSPGRIYVMSSHFDDCDGDCTDGAGIAPGADDNGS